MRLGHTNQEIAVIQLPSPTVFPMVLALGITLMCAGLVTNIVIGLLGLLLTVWAGVGWFMEVLPHEHHVGVVVHTEQVAVTSLRTLSERHAAGASHRKVLPVETFHITTGIKGGIAGGIAMVIPATLFSVLKYHSVWYAMNLLAAGGFVTWAGASDAFLSQFHLQGLLAAIVIHSIVSVLVGLLYGAMLPMFPRLPIVTAGFMVPLLFTGILYSALSIVSPILNQRIDWFWFVVSQIAFGLVCGFVVNLQARIRTPQFRALSFAVRAGIHSDQDEHTSSSEARPDEKDRP